MQVICIGGVGSITAYHECKNLHPALYGEDPSFVSDLSFFVDLFVLALGYLKCRAG